MDSNSTEGASGGGDGTAKAQPPSSSDASSSSTQEVTAISSTDVTNNKGSSSTATTSTANNNNNKILPSDSANQPVADNKSTSAPLPEAVPIAAKNNSTTTSTNKPSTTTTLNPLPKPTSSTTTKTTAAAKPTKPAPTGFSKKSTLSASSALQRAAAASKRKTSPILNSAATEKKKGGGGGKKKTVAKATNPVRNKPGPKAGSTAASKKKSQPDKSPSSTLSAQQIAVKDMMRRALEEDQYSALGSVVDTDSSDDDEEEDKYDKYTTAIGSSGDESIRRNHRPSRSNSLGELGLSPAERAWLNSSTGGGGSASSSSTTTKINRNSIMMAMRKHLAREGMKSVRNFDGSAFLNDVDSNKRSRSISPHPTHGGDDDGEEYAIDGRRIGKRRKKKKKKKVEKQIEDGGSAVDTPMSQGSEGDEEENVGVESGGGGDNNDEDHVGVEEDTSIFGQTAGAANATWVECDRCKKWRRLRGVVDARKLPSRWFCSMNKTDPDRARCSAPEEEYDSASTPESAIDQRTRKHLRVWVRRLHCNEAYENRQRSLKKRAAAASGPMDVKEPYEWIRCCNPSCGKWRMLLRSMTASTVMDSVKNGEWYCVMNTWDEKAASCGAAQESLPSVGCPPWVLVDQD